MAGVINEPIGTNGPIFWYAPGRPILNAQDAAEAALLELAYSVRAFALGAPEAGGLHLKSAAAWGVVADGFRQGGR